MSKTRILNGTVTTVLVMLLMLSMLSVFTIMPANANPGQSSGIIRLGATGSSEAKWDSTKKQVGNYAVKLHDAGDESYAYVEISVPTGIKFSELATITSGWSFWYYWVSENGHYGPLLELRFTGPNFNPDTLAEHVDITVNTAESDPVGDTWTEESVDSSSTATCYGNKPDGTTFSDADGHTGTSPGTHTLSEIVADITDYVSGSGDWELTRIQVQLGWDNVADTAYIDDITIKGVTYTLDPPGMAISPTSGVPGTTVTVDAWGFNGGENVQIYLNNTYIKTVSADGVGNVSTTLTIPTTATYAAYTVEAIGVTSGVSVSATFHATRLTITPTSGNVGDTLSAEGWGLKAGEYARVYFDIDADGTMDTEEIMAIVPVDTGGHFLTSFTVPQAKNGTHTVKAIQSSTPSATDENPEWYASANFIVQPKIWLSPTSGPSGITVKVFGNGFSASADNVTIFFDKDKDGVMDANEIVACRTSTVNIGTNTTGGLRNNTASVGYLNFVVPEVEEYGPYTVWVNSTNTVIASATFTVGPASITLTPGQGIVGATVNIEGAGFTPDKTVDVFFDKDGDGIATSADADYKVVTEASVGSDGTFTATFPMPVPTPGPGRYVVNATDGSVFATANFTIPAPSITLNATQLPPGGALRITGTNFGNSSEGYTVKVYFNTLEQTPTLSVDKYGNVDANLTILTAAGLKVYVVNVTLSDGGTHSQFNATRTLTVPEAYIELNPSSGTPGQEITITGYWFEVDATVAVKVAGTDVTTTPPSVKVLPNGTFTATFEVPALPAGSYTVEASTVTTSATTTLTVTSPETQTILSAIEELEKKLDNVLGNLTSTNFGLSAIKTVVDEINSKLSNLATDISSINSAISLISGKLGAFNPGDTVASLLYSINDSVSVINWTDIAAIKTAVKTDIPATLELIKAKTDKLGTFTGTDTVASLLSEIKGATGQVNATLNTVANKVNSIGESLTSVVDALGEFREVLGEFGEGETVAGLLHEIKGKLDQLSIVNPVQFSAGSYSTAKPTSTNPVNLEKSSKVTLTVRVRDDMSAGFRVTVYIQNGASSWQPLTFIASGASYTDCATTVEFTTGANGKFYFDVTGATFTAYIYSAESAP